MASLLVVDDEMEVRELLRSSFGRKGYEVVTVPQVEQALEALTKRPFDLVILDAHFPDDSGDRLIRRVRAARNLIPVIVYSGDVSPQEQQQYRAAGAADVVMKGDGFSALLAAVSKALSPGAPSAAAPASAAPAPRNVLVVDDDAAVRRVLRRFLESKHFGVTEAESGDAALGIVRAGARFAAVFLDINMPGRDGLSTLEEMRTVRPDLGVIVVTGEQDEHAVGRAVELGAAGYVIKPFDFLYLEMLLLSRLKAGAA